LAVFLCLATPICAEAKPADSATERPNFVFILIDDMGWKDVGCYGAKVYETPNINRLAAQGMRFTDAYASPVCSPTRASLMTGKNPARLHLTEFIPQIGRQLPSGKLIPPDFQQTLPPDELTVAEALKAGGYTCASIGKWHLGEEHGPQFRPQNQGFDRVVLSHHHGYFNYFYPFVDHQRWPYAGPLPGQEGDYLPDRLTDEALSFLEAQAEVPFFLYLSHWSVHGPYQAPEAMVARYRAKGLEGKKAVYAAMVESVDQSVGRVMEKLDQLGLAERTVLVFMSDNGGTGVTSMAPLRGIKATLYEGGIRVPLIVRWPGHVPSGSTCTVPVISHDLYPTFLQLADLPPQPEQHCDGVSLAGLLEGADRLEPDRQALYWHYPHYHRPSQPCGAIRSGRWKLVEHFETGRVELFDLQSDVAEKHDLAAEMPDRARQLAGQLAAWRDRVGAQMPSRAEGTAQHEPNIRRFQCPALTVTGNDIELAELRDGQRAFRNRSYIWQEIPEAYHGWRYTRKHGGRKPELTVVAKRDGRLLSVMKEYDKEKR